MSVEISKKVAELLDEKVAEEDIGQPHFGSADYELLPLTAESFMCVGEIESNRKVTYIDGGNQEILGAPNFSVQMNRLYFNIFKGRNRILPKSLPSRIEFYSATLPDYRHDEIFYDTKIFPLKDEFADLIPDEHHLSFSSSDRTVTVGTQRADVERVASIARRFAEWEFAKHVTESELEEGDIVVHDGALQTGFTNEQRYTERAFDAAVKKRVTFTGLSKTSALFTTTGLSLLGAVQKLAEECKVAGPWCLPVAKVLNVHHNAFIYVVKLHENARYVFRYEVYGDQARKMSEQSLGEITSVLAENSKDIAFPGYPYGLIDADRFARVSGNEIEKYQVLLLSEISKLGKWKDIARHVSSGDAHSVLDMLKG